METEFQLIDCDYVLLGNEPIIRLFGKTHEGKTVCAFYKKFYPYFYVLPMENAENDVIEYIKNNFIQNLVGIERVKKFLPFGFQKSKTEMLKIILKDPSQVPIVRDSLLIQSFVKEVFEADILFKYRFMADSNLSGMKWVKLTGSGVSTTTVKANLCFSANTVTVMENDHDVDLKYMAVDIEIVPRREGVPDSSKDKIAIISLSFQPHFNQHKNLVLLSKPIKSSKHDVMVFQNEEKMLEKFVEIVDNYDPDVIVGYNANNFDIPFILDRLAQCKISRSFGRCKQKQVFSRKFANRFRTSVTGRVIVDPYDLIKESASKGFIRLKRYGLGDVSKALLHEDKIDIAHSEIASYWNGSEEQMDKLIEYAGKDSELALKLLLQHDMLSKFIEISKLSGLLLQDVLDGGESTRVENLLLREFAKRDYVIPLKPSDKETFARMDEREANALKGALVLEPEVGLQANPVVYLDFKSMYPSIFMQYNICPTTMITSEEAAKEETIGTPYGTKFVSKNVKEGIIPKIVEYLIKERSKVKRQISKETDESRKKVLDARQYAFKIVANSFYGYTGYVRARFYVLDIANAITSCGRALIQKTRDVVETGEDYKVVYGDTDSIMVKVKAGDLEEALEIGKIIEDKINKNLGGVVEIKIESVFKSLLVLTKKRYAGLSFEKTNGEWEEKIIMKGIETVRRDWCDLVSETLYEVLNIILRNQNPKEAVEYVKKILTCLEKNEIPVEKLIITKSISKSLKDYKGVQPHVELVKKLRKRDPSNAPGPGDRIGYVIIKGLQLMSDRAEDPQYVKENKLKIDSKYYIESQILPPLERVFDVMNVDKTELLSAGKQMLLTDTIKNNLKKADQESVLENMTGCICSKCSRTVRRPPLIGKCIACGGELLFYSGDTKSRYCIA